MDTNVLVRYLTRDDPDQYRRAVEFFDSVRFSDEPVRVDAVVLCELVWVLRSSYRYSKRDLADVVEKLLSAQQLAVEDADTVWLALSDFKSSNADFADCLIGRRNLASECTSTVTFDDRLKGLDTFELLSRTGSR